MWHACPFCSYAVEGQKGNVVQHAYERCKNYGDIGKLFAEFGSTCLEERKSYPIEVVPKQNGHPIHAQRPHTFLRDITRIASRLIGDRTGVVQDIVGHRWNRGKREFKIRWMDCDESKDTWELE